MSKAAGVCLLIDSDDGQIRDLKRAMEGSILSTSLSNRIPS
jgi:hypothetical protein